MADIDHLLIPIQSVRMLRDVQMIDLHDDNGPGRVECPVCGATISMRWFRGSRKDTPDELEHEPFCPVGWAQRREPEQAEVDDTEAAGARDQAMSAISDAIDSLDPEMARHEIVALREDLIRRSGLIKPAGRRE